MTPVFRILADNRDISDLLRDRLLALNISDRAGVESDTVEIHLDDRDARIALPPKEAKLEVSLGYEEEGLVGMGVYTVDEIELEGPPDTLIIRAKGADMLGGLKEQKTRSWDDVALGDLVATVAAEHGLKARVGERLRTVRVSHLDQTGESDLHFLTRLAKDYGAIAKPAGAFLLFVPRGEGKSAAGKPVPHVTLRREDTRDHRVTLADRGKYGGVVANWCDTDAGTRTPVQVGWGKPLYTLRHDYPDADAAKAAARAEFEALNQGLATASLTLSPGNPMLSAEGRLTLKGFRSGVDREWIATRVDHELSDSGYTTRVEAETPKA